MKSISVDALTVKDHKIIKWLKPVKDEPLTFTTTSTANGKAFTISPYYDLHRQRYVVYWDLN